MLAENGDLYEKMLQPLSSIAVALAIAEVPAAAMAEVAVMGKVAPIQLYYGHTGLLIQLNVSPVNPERFMSPTWLTSPLFFHPRWVRVFRPFEACGQGAGT